MTFFDAGHDMKVFISWSGARSNAVAEFLAEWLQCVIQNCRPWVSSHGIDAGSIWFQGINEALQDSKLGIVCLTQANKENPWILFEAGALARGITTQRVCTFLSDLKPSDVRDPLAQFNHTIPEEESIRKLVLLINSMMGDYSMKERVVDKVFAQYWKSFPEEFQRILSENPEKSKAKPRTEPEIMEEILGTVRRLDHRIQELEPQPRPSTIGDTIYAKSRSVSSQFKPSDISLHDLRNKIKVLIKDGLSSEEILKHPELYGHSPELIGILLNKPTAVRRR